eukprot:5188614-Ditylum_brightwellii.AAC.1
MRDDVEVIWGKTISVDCVMEANWPNITIFDTKQKIAKFVKLSTSLGANIVIKTADKIHKY